MDASHLSEQCVFAESINNRISERFVTGVNNVKIQQKLLLDAKLTLGKAIQLATSNQQTTGAARAPDLTATVNSLRGNSKSGRLVSTLYSAIAPLKVLYIANPQQGDLGLSGPPSGQGAGSGARTRTEGSLQNSGRTR
ncbi:hypothetical protein PoB_004820000 [Plakobranchus ocellatus]|uniref:BLOC-1-related complex subunit 7 n=1 Tax=Plakobranchus ocellatus TaxID=259542 RepID=A0AAV4BR01_9GAST|nr:hypothetical protein PoB_004820000 [Plakobranchus ocellatus]